MKVLECNRCHHLFKQSDDHITYYCRDEGNINYCKECSEKLLQIVGAGMDILSQLHDDGINPFESTNLKRAYARKLLS